MHDTRLCRVAQGLQATRIVLSTIIGIYELQLTYISVPLILLCIRYTYFLLILTVHRLEIQCISMSSYCVTVNRIGC